MASSLTPRAWSTATRKKTAARGSRSRSRSPPNRRRRNNRENGTRMHTDFEHGFTRIPRSQAPLGNASPEALLRVAVRNDLNDPHSLSHLRGKQAPFPHLHRGCLVAGFHPV